MKGPPEGETHDRPKKVTRREIVTTYHHSTSGIGSFDFSLVIILSDTSIRFGFMSGSAFAFANCSCFVLSSFVRNSPNWLLKNQKFHS